MTSPTKAKVMCTFDTSDISCIAVVFEGSGDPSDLHAITGIIFYGQNGEAVRSVGNIDPVWMKHGPPNRTTIKEVQL
jgi:hypothetical protein